MKSKKIMIVKRFILIILTLLITQLVIADDVNLTKYKEQFKTGVLKDFTPEELYSKSDDLKSSGPFIILVGIDRKSHPLDIRPVKERENIMFSLIEGKGSFAVLGSPDTKTEQILTVNPGEEGFVLVLFYPKVTTTENQCEVQVTVQGNTNITGELNYKYKIVPLNNDGFLKACELMVDTKDKYNQFLHSENITSTTTTYDHLGANVVDKKTKNLFFSSDGQGNTELREENNKGKLISKRKEVIKSSIDQSICSFSKNWGETNTSYIYFVPDLTSNVVNFYFCDKNLFVFTKQITMTSNYYLVDESNYDSSHGYLLMKSASHQQKYLWGGAEKITETIHTLNQ